MCICEYVQFAHTICLYVCRLCMCEWVPSMSIEMKQTEIGLERLAQKIGKMSWMKWHEHLQCCPVLLVLACVRNQFSVVQCVCVGLRERDGFNTCLGCMCSSMHARVSFLRLAWCMHSVVVVLFLFLYAATTIESRVSLSLSVPYGSSYSSFSIYFSTTIDFTRFCMILHRIACLKRTGHCPIFLALKMIADLACKVKRTVFGIEGCNSPRYMCNITIERFCISCVAGINAEVGAFDFSFYLLVVWKNLTNRSTPQKVGRSFLKYFLWKWEIDGWQTDSNHMRS